jgi:hypothetical protein
MLEPLNTEWNRKTGMLPGKGKTEFLGIKHGIAYFIWTDPAGSIVFLQCDEGVLKKHFKVSDENPTELVKEPEKLVLLQQRKTKFLKYPFEVIL